MSIMSPDLEEIEERLMQLEPHDRASLAHRLLESLDMLSDEENERLWTAEAEGRYENYRSGKGTAIDGDEVFARARSRNK
jgi:putative addiction module component (TIGR02574 family)